MDRGSAAFITWTGPARGMHPDLAADVSTGSVQDNRLSHAIVDRNQPKLALHSLRHEDGHLRDARIADTQYTSVTLGDRRIFPPLPATTEQADLGFDG